MNENVNCNRITNLAWALFLASPSWDLPGAGEFADGSSEPPTPSAPGCPHRGCWFLSGAVGSRSLAKAFVERTAQEESGRYLRWNDSSMTSGLAFNVVYQVLSVLAVKKRIGLPVEASASLSSEYLLLSSPVPKAVTETCPGKWFSRLGYT